MPSFRALGNKFFGKTIGEAAAFALGGAMRSPLEPPLAELTNETWAKFVDAGVTLPLDPGDAADIAAEDVASVPWAKDQAKQTGIGGAQMDNLIGAARNAPGLETLYGLWRRSLITTAQFEHGLRKAKYEAQWDKPLMALRDTLLSSEELAMMQQQGFIPETRANAEGALQGVTPERQQLRFEASGLPPGVETALQMLRRSIITDAEFGQIVREGHTKTKYTDELLALRDVVLGHNDYVTARVRGWIDDQAMYDGGALTGYSREQMDTLFKNHGRPLSWHQIFIGLRRGGEYEGSVSDVDPAFLKGLQESDIRPEWYSLAWAQRYNYPSAFVLRALVQSGDLTQAEGERILLYEGWEPTLAKTVSTKWAGGAAGTSKSETVSDLLALYESGKRTQAQVIADMKAMGYSAEDAQAKIDAYDARRVTSEKTRAITAGHKAFLGGVLAPDEALALLKQLGIAEWAADEMLATWITEKLYAPG